MTAPHAATYRRPADWKQFERLSLAVMSCVFKSRFDQYGREGQRQHGVDLYCRLKNGSLIAVQCKGRNENLGKNLTLAQVNQAALRHHSLRFFLSLHPLSCQVPIQGSERLGTQQIRNRQGGCADRRRHYLRQAMRQRISHALTRLRSREIRLGLLTHSLKRWTYVR